MKPQVKIKKKMEMKKLINKIPIRTLLIILVLLTFVASGVTFSRFIAVSVGSDSARVAKTILITEVRKDSQIVEIDLEEMKPGDYEEYDFSVTNYDGERSSEISYRFEIVLTRTNNIPIDIYITENWTGGDTFLYDEIEENITTDSYNVYAGTAQQLDFLIIFDWDEQEDDPSYESLTESVSLNVYWEQII